MKPYEVTWRRLVGIQRDEARRLGVAFEVLDQAPAGTHCAECGHEKIGPVARVAGHLVCSPWCARMVLEAGAAFEPVEPDEAPADVAPVASHGCDECERANGPGGACTCDQVADDEPEPEPEPLTLSEARGVLASLQVGARFEVKRFGRWVLARVAGESLQVDGAGSLFPSAPVRVLTVETLTTDGGRGDAFVMREDRALPVRLVEVGLFD